MASSQSRAQIQSCIAFSTRRLNDLETFQLPRLEQCLGPLDLQRELCDEFRADLEEVRYSLEVLKEISESLSYAEKVEIQPQIQELERLHHTLQTSFRAASLHSKKVISSRRSRVQELAEKNKRYELDESRLGEGTIDRTGGSGDKYSANGDNSRKGKGREARSAAEFGMGGDDELQTKTNEVTTALRRTTALMQNELERSVLSVQMLESSTQTLLSTSNLYDTYSSLLRISGQLVKAIEKADTFDRLIIFAALFFFLCVVGFIVKRRVLDRTVGVVLGGVGKGVGWYLFGTARLIGLAFGRGSGRRKANKMLNVSPGHGHGIGDGKSDQASLNTDPMSNLDNMQRNTEDGLNSRTTAQINSDSAIGGEKVDADVLPNDSDRANDHSHDHGQVIEVNLAPGHIAYNPQEGTPKAGSSGNAGGKVEIIAQPNPPHIEERLEREREVAEGQGQAQEGGRVKDEL